ncbi:hypothetical protein MTO96_030272 [Rhipicephalus appendiculatus]
MKNIIVTACLFGVLAVTAWASTLPEDEAKVVDSSETASHDLANEAIALGQILREVAADMAQDKAFNAGEEEYSFRSFWEKFKAFNEKGRTETAAKIALEKAQEALKKKAVTLVANIFEKSISSYAVEDNVNEADFFEQLRVQIDQVGQRLINQGQALKVF